MNISKNKVLLAMLISIGALALIFSLITKFIYLAFALLIATGLFLSCKFKRGLDVLVYTSLGVVFFLPKLEGVFFNTSILSSITFIVSYIVLCVSGVLFTIKLGKRIRDTLNKNKSMF